MRLLFGVIPKAHSKMSIYKPCQKVDHWHQFSLSFFINMPKVWCSETYSRVKLRSGEMTIKCKLASKGSRHNVNRCILSPKMLYILLMVFIVVFGTNLIRFHSTLMSLTVPKSSLIDSCKFISSLREIFADVGISWPIITISMHVKNHCFWVAAFSRIMKVIKSDLFTIHICSLKFKGINLCPFELRVQKSNVLPFKLIISFVVTKDFFNWDLMQVFILGQILIDFIHIYQRIVS